MTLQNLAAVATPIIFLIFALAWMGARAWVKKYVESHVQSSVERRTNELRSELRKSEEGFISSLRNRESELAALREGILGGRTTRMTLIDQRRMQAVEKLWVGVCRLSRMKGAALTVSMLKLDEVAEQTPRDDNLRQFLSLVSESFGGGDFREKLSDLNTDYERPFVSELAWALYSAYSSIILGGWVILKTLQTGMEDPLKLIKRDHSSDLLKTVLPEYSNYIDAHGESAHYALLEKLEEKILHELRHNMAGADSDEENIKRSSEIMSAVAKAEAGFHDIQGLTRQSATNQTQSPHPSGR